MALRGLIMDYAGVLTDGAEMRDLPRRARAAGRPTALVSSAGSVSREIEADIRTWLLAVLAVAETDD